MTDDQTKQERDILVLMRKVLTSVVKDTTPQFRSMKHPLSDNTIEQIRTCLKLIAVRERELADQAGMVSEKPYFSDDPDVEKTDVVSIHTLKKPKKKKREQG